MFGDKQREYQLTDKEVGEIITMRHDYIKCPECPKCKPQPGKRDGVKWGICHNGGNMVYLEPRKIKRASGSGYVYKPISSCGMYEKGKR